MQPALPKGVTTVATEPEMNKIRNGMGWAVSVGQEQHVQSNTSISACKGPRPGSRYTLPQNEKWSRRKG